ncbi:hypothetical protein BZA70DRAFT_267155 [Myxozyma melibiosi]|uniref:Uncharacterized protein n=1 Tax=Myxozyma melibiosi TaxID=54550 RepID=A0ABR1F664_9ASCO
MARLSKNTNTNTSRRRSTPEPHLSPSGNGSSSPFSSPSRRVQSSLHKFFAKKDGHRSTLSSRRSPSPTPSRRPTSAHVPSSRYLKKPLGPDPEEIMRKLHARSEEIRKSRDLIEENKRFHEANLAEAAASEDAADIMVSPSRRREKGDPRTSAFTTEFLKSSLGSKAARRMQRLLRKQQKEQDRPVFVFFRPLGEFRAKRERFPVFKDVTRLEPWIQTCLLDASTRSNMFESGFIKYMLDTGKKIPYAIKRWLMLESISLLISTLFKFTSADFTSTVSAEPNAVLANAYLNTLLSCDTLPIDKDVVSAMMLNLGVDEDVAKLTTPLTLTLPPTHADDEDEDPTASHPKQNPKPPDEHSKTPASNIENTLSLFTHIVHKQTYRDIISLFMFALCTLLDSSFSTAPLIVSAASKLLSAIILARTTTNAWLASLPPYLFELIRGAPLRARLLAILPVSAGDPAIALRTQLALAFFLDDIEGVMREEVHEAKRLPIAKRIIPELNENLLYRLRMKQDAEVSEGDDTRDDEEEEQEEEDEEMFQDAAESVSPSLDTPNETDDDDDDASSSSSSTSSTSSASSKFDYPLLAHKITFLNYALQSYVRIGKDHDKINYIITAHLSRLQKQIFNPDARFRDRTVAVLGLRALEYRLRGMYVDSRQSVLERRRVASLKRRKRKREE